MFESSSCLDKAVVFGSVVVEIKKFVSFPGEKTLHVLRDYLWQYLVFNNLYLQTYCHKNQFILI